MVTRQCMICGMTAHSADSSGDWACLRPGCKGTLTPDMNQPTPAYGRRFDDVQPKPEPARIAPIITGRAGIMDAMHHRGVGQIGATKLTSAKDWSRIEHLVSNILQALVSKCCDMRCAQDCVTCPIIGAKKDAAEIVKLMEEIG